MTPQARRVPRPRAAACSANEALRSLRVTRLRQARSTKPNVTGHGACRSRSLSTPPRRGMFAKRHARHRDRACRRATRSAPRRTGSIASRTTTTSYAMAALPVFRIEVVDAPDLTGVGVAVAVVLRCRAEVADRVARVVHAADFVAVLDRVSVPENRRIAVDASLTRRAVAVGPAVGVRQTEVLSRPADAAAAYRRRARAVLILATPMVRTGWKSRRWTPTRGEPTIVAPSLHAAVAVVIPCTSASVYGRIDISSETRRARTSDGGGVASDGRDARRRSVGRARLWRFWRSSVECALAIGPCVHGRCRRIVTPT